MSEVRPGLSLLVLSPHLDDAALSCGGVLTGLSGDVRASVATFFTTAGADPLPTRSGRAFLAVAHRAGAPGEPDPLFAARRAEDLEALSPWAEVVHVGLTDGIFRRRRAPVPRALARRVPELVHVYRTYRFGLAAGRVARADHECPRQVGDWIRQWVADHAGGDHLVLAPLGAGGHVDHVLVRDAACAAVPADRLGFYADHPYVLTSPPDPEFLTSRSLTRTEYSGGAVRKRDLVLHYRTQAAALYPEGVPLTGDELWWGPEIDGPATLVRLTT
ncbi:MAG: PIG-L family deacetylase [Kineosporiaceae bacterium]|nr:PIG-L family deacetylase [Kineosporiaceae bacterium]